MAYTKKTWVSGETPCSSENFNHMEQGIADAHNKLDELNTKINVDVLWCYTNAGNFSIPISSKGNNTTIMVVIGSRIYAIYISGDRSSVKTSSSDITASYADGSLTISGTMEWYCFGFYIVAHN